MKNALIRITALAIVATTISAFGIPPEEKAAKTSHCGNKSPSAANFGAKTTPCVPDQDNSVQENSGAKGKNLDQKKNSTKPNRIEQQEKQWLHDLQGISG